MAEIFIEGDSMANITGDNTFHGVDGLLEACESFRSRANVAARPANDLERCGVVECDDLGRGFTRSAASTPSGLYEASVRAQGIEERGGVKIGGSEGAALRRGFLTLEAFEALAERLPACECRDYMLRLAAEAARQVEGD